VKVFPPSRQELQRGIITRHGKTQTSRSNLTNHSTGDDINSLSEVEDVPSTLVEEIESSQHNILVLINTHVNMVKN